MLKYVYIFKYIIFLQLIRNGRRTLHSTRAGQVFWCTDCKDPSPTRGQERDDGSSDRVSRRPYIRGGDWCILPDDWRIRPYELQLLGIHDYLGTKQGDQRPEHSKWIQLLSSTATEAIAKIEKLSKLIVGANVSIRDIFFVKAINENIPEGGRMAMINAMALLVKESDNTHFIEFNAAFRQSFPTPSTHSTFANFDHKNYNSKPRDYSKDKSRDKYRNKSPHSSFNRNRQGSGSRADRSTTRSRCGRNDSGANRSGSTSVSFHTSSPNGITGCARTYWNGHIRQ